MLTMTSTQPWPLFFSKRNSWNISRLSYKAISFLLLRLSFKFAPMYSLKESVVKGMGVLDVCGDFNNRLYTDVGGLIAVYLRVAYVCITWRNNPPEHHLCTKDRPRQQQQLTQQLAFYFKKIARKRIKRRRARLNKCVQNMGGCRPHPSSAECYRHLLFFCPAQTQMNTSLTQFSPPMPESATQETTTSESGAIVACCKSRWREQAGGKSERSTVSWIKVFVLLIKKK